MAGGAGRFVSARGNLAPLDGILIVVGVVVGVGIFRVPSVVAGLVDGPWQMMALWVAGALAALVGALCYAELASVWPSRGGEYHFLRQAFGARLGLLFVWARVTVIQTGAIAAVAFVFGDYAGQLVNVPPWVLALAAIMAASAVNLAGWQPGKMAQRVLTLTTMGAVLLMAGMGLAAEPMPAIPSGQEPGADGAALGMAMVFVMLAYGGWNEAAYLGGDVARGRMIAVLAGGIAVVAALYLLLNAAFLSVLGLEGMRNTDTVAADAMRHVMGEKSAMALSLIVALASLSTLNATIITGSRAMTALGRDLKPLQALANDRASILAQAAWALALVGLGSLARDGFTAMIEFTAPVFWLFLVLVGLSVFVLRRRVPAARIPFRAPLHPLMPLLFCAASLYMLQASIAYVGLNGLIGLGLLALGLPFVWWAGTR